MYCVIDIETAGWSTEKNGICEIGLIAADVNFNILEENRILIKPYTRPFSTQLVSYKPDAMKINGLTEQLLIDKGVTPFDAILATFDFIDKHNIAALVTHNGTIFDMPKLEYLANRFCDFTFKDFNHQDTLLISSKKFALNSYSLPFLCGYFGIEHNNAHTALGDCRATLELFKILKNGTKIL